MKIRLPVEQRTLVSKLDTTLLRSQPFLTFPIFLSILLGAPPLWLSWLIALIPLALRLCLTRRIIYRTPFDVSIFLLTAGMVVGFLVSPDLNLRLTAIHTLLACALFYYGIVSNRHAPAGYWGTIITSLFLILLFLSIWHFAEGVPKRFTYNAWIYKWASALPLSLGVSLSPNVMGGAFAVVIPGLLAIALSIRETWIRWSAAVLAVAFAAITVLSASGGGIIATVAGMLLVLFWLSRKAFWSTIALLVVIGTTWPVWSTATWAKAAFSLQALINRMDIWKTTISAIKEYPLTGFGLGGWWARVPGGSGVSGPHNAYLGLYSDTGILGIVALILALIIFVRLLRQIIRSNREMPNFTLALGIAGGIIAGGIHALIDDNLNILFPTSGEYLYFAVPFLWLWAALLSVACPAVKNKASVVTSPKA